MPNIYSQQGVQFQKATVVLSYALLEEKGICGAISFNFCYILLWLVRVFLGQNIEMLYKAKAKEER